MVSRFQMFLIRSPARSVSKDRFSPRLSTDHCLFCWITGWCVYLNCFLHHDNRLEMCLHHKYLLFNRLGAPLFFGFPLLPVAAATAARYFACTASRRKKLLTLIIYSTFQATPTLALPYAKDSMPGCLYRSRTIGNFALQHHAHDV